MLNHKFFTKQNFEQRPETDPLRFEMSGDPMPFFKSRHINRKAWDGIQQAITSYKGNLRNAAEDRCFTGPIYVDTEFYFPFRYKNETYLIDRPMDELPQLSRLIQFVEECMLELHITTSHGQLSSLFAKKLWSDKPRTSFVVYEVVA